MRIHPGLEGVRLVLAVAGDVEPVPAPPLAVVGVRQEPVDDLRERLGRLVAANASTSSGVGGRPIRSNVARRIKARRSAGATGMQPLRLELPEDEAVDRPSRPRLVA